MMWKQHLLSISSGMSQRKLFTSLTVTTQLCWKVVVVSWSWLSFLHWNSLSANWIRLARSAGDDKETPKLQLATACFTFSMSLNCLRQWKFRGKNMLAPFTTNKTFCFSSVLARNRNKIIKKSVFCLHNIRLFLDASCRLSFFFVPIQSLVAQADLS